LSNLCHRQTCLSELLLLFKNKISSLTKPISYGLWPPEVDKEIQVLIVVIVCSYWPNEHTGIAHSVNRPQV